MITAAKAYIKSTSGLTHEEITSIYSFAISQLIQYVEIKILMAIRNNNRIVICFLNAANYNVLEYDIPFIHEQVYDCLQKAGYEVYCIGGDFMKPTIKIDWSNSFELLK